MDKREQRTVVVPWTGAEATFEAWPEQGAWYEVGHNPSGDEVGFLYAPMLLDGSFHPDEIGEVEISYIEASGQCPEGHEYDPDNTGCEVCMAFALAHGHA